MSQEGGIERGYRGTRASDDDVVDIDEKKEGMRGVVEDEERGVRERVTETRMKKKGANFKYQA